MRRIITANNRRGVELIIIIVFTAILLAVFTAALGLINSERRLSKRTADRESQFQIAEAGIDYYRWHLAHDPLDYQDGNEVLVSNFTPAGYPTAFLDIGEMYYEDQNYTLIALPASLDAKLWVKTRQADAADNSDIFMSFEVNRATYVYLGYDQRGTPPDWLTSTFTDTGEIIDVSDIGATPLKLWRRQFSAGTVTLGGNLAQGASGASSMYTVTLAAAPSNGPFIRSFTNYDGELIGSYSLNVTPPALGSTITTVSSTGYLIDNPNSQRTIVARFGIPSFSQYAVVADDVMRFGSGTETFGPIHSNYGIRFDGIAAHGIVTSACTTYDDPDHIGPNEDCVHTHLPNPNTVFLGGRQFPVAPVDFSGITADLSTLKGQSQEPSGIYLPPSGRAGYHLVLKTSGQLDMYQVDSQSFCRYRPSSTWRSYNDIWSINSQSSFTYNGSSSINYPLPANGIIFAEDDVWVDGQIDDAKLTIVAAREPLASGQATIVINNDLSYTNYDGRDTIGLIAQKDISVGFYSDNDIRIDAAVIAQTGRAGRYHYTYYNLAANRYDPLGCGSRLTGSPPGYVYRDTLTLFGSIATNQRYGFAWTDGTGYQNRNLIFDDHLIFGPPPSFPTTGEYAMISWEEK